MPEVAPLRTSQATAAAGRMYRIARGLDDAGRALGLDDAGRALGEIYGVLPEAQRLAVDDALGDADFHRRARAMEAIADKWLEALKPELSK